MISRSTSLPFVDGGEGGVAQDKPETADASTDVTSDWEYFSFHQSLPKSRMSSTRRSSVMIEKRRIANLPVDVVDDGANGGDQPDYLSEVDIGRPYQQSPLATWTYITKKSVQLGGDTSGDRVQSQVMEPPTPAVVESVDDAFLRLRLSEQTESIVRAIKTELRKFDPTTRVTESDRRQWFQHTLQVDIDDHNSSLV